MSQDNRSNADTVYLYETIEVYDTIFVYDTIHIPPKIVNLENINPKQLTILEFDSITNKANILIISEDQTATIPINGIILNENLKQNKSMKKMSFFTVLCFAANTMLFAQTEFGISAGTGLWKQFSTREFVEAPPVAPMLSMGLFIRQPIANDNLAIKLEVNYAFLKSVGKYVYGEEGSGYFQRYYEYYDGMTFASKSFIDANTRYGNNLHNLTVPLSIYWNKNKLQPFVGINYYILGYNTSEYNAVQGLGLHGGIAFKINNKFTIGCVYYFKDYDYGEGGSSRTDDQVLLSEHIWMRNNQIRLNLNYTFGKKTKAKVHEDVIVPSY